MFGSIGMPELILIFIVALLVFGPKKLPELGKSLGRGLAEFKRASDDLKKTIEDEIEQGKHEAESVKKQVAEVRSTLDPTAPSPAPAQGSSPQEAAPQEAAPQGSAPQGSVPRADSPIRPA
jgi:TatA/E family protein of Tat protein translocase